MKLPKVLVFTVTYAGKDYCLDEWLGYVKKLSYPNKRHIIIDNSNDNLVYYNKLKEKLTPLGIEVYHIERGNNSREAIARGQNFARKIALEEGYDYLFSLESDIMCPPNIIESLMAWGVDIVTGLYLLGDKHDAKVRIPCITVPEFHKELGAFGTRLLRPEEWVEWTNKGIKQCQAGGMGCCLMSEYALRKTPFYYDTRFKGHSDIYFFNRMFELRVPVFIDTDCYCEHKNSDWSKVEDR